MKKISSQSRDNIISLIDSGLTTGKIAAQLRVSQSTVSRVRKESRESVQKSRGGRPAKLTTRDKRKLAQRVCSGKADNATQMKNELKNINNINTSSDTVCRALKQAVMKATTKKKNLGCYQDIKKKERTSLFAIKTGQWKAGKG